MNHKNLSTDNKPHANPANSEMIHEKEFMYCLLKRKIKFVQFLLYFKIICNRYTDTII